MGTGRIRKLFYNSANNWIYGGHNTCCYRLACKPNYNLGGHQIDITPTKKHPQNTSPVHPLYPQDFPRISHYVPIPMIYTTYIISSQILIHHDWFYQPYVWLFMVTINTIQLKKEGLQTQRVYKYYSLHSNHSLSTINNHK